MEEERQAKVKRIIITVLIVLVAFFIILGSALLTMKFSNNNKNSKTNKVVSLQNSNKNQKKELLENEKTNIKENKLEEKNNETNIKENKNEESKNILSNIVNEIQNKFDEEKNQENLGGRIPVSNPEAIALCKKAQTSDEKNIYLTFDDGPSPNVTPQILSILKQYNVPATFFILGSRAELYPELVKREYNEGHYLANHGYSHKYSSIYSSVQAVIDEYNKCDEAIQTALNNQNFHTYLFRFPGGSSGGPYNDLKQTAKATLENMGIASTNWNCLNGDAEGTGRTKEQLIKRLYETANGWNSLVVLMHDADDKQTTVDALPEIIEHYQAEGYTFKNYYDIFK